MSFNLILIASATIFIASIIPGPSMLLALTHGMHHGARRTTVSAMGNASVTFIQASISLAGLGTILFTSEIVFQLIKWAGAGYLIYMGISLLRSSEMFVAPTATTAAGFIEQTSLRKLYLQAVFVTAGNPKAIIFFSAVFPQLITPNTSYLSQFVILVGICVFSTFCCFMIYAVGGQKIASLLSKATVGRYIKGVIGGTFIGAGVSLAVSNR
ncbi:MAG: LysE family translocator [Gammaproteobacteria bacterium]|nr:LysE family translocator [Gammaproteobacteria bacterium]